MAAKTDSKDIAPTPAKDASEGAPAVANKPIAALLPVVAVVVLAPVLSFAIGQYVLIPQLKKQVAALPADLTVAAAPAASSHGGHGSGKKSESSSGNPSTYELENVVVNLAGTLGTRYLKVTFQVSGDNTLRASFDQNKPKLMDITINVLSSHSLADLEEAGAKNIMREKLVVAYNQAIGRKVVDQLYFTEFVVQ